MVLIIESKNKIHYLNMQQKIEKHGGILLIKCIIAFFAIAAIMCAWQNQQESRMLNLCPAWSHYDTVFYSDV